MMLLSTVVMSPFHLHFTDKDTILLLTYCENLELRVYVWIVEFALKISCEFVIILCALETVSFITLYRMFLNPDVVPYWWMEII